MSEFFKPGETYVQDEPYRAPEILGVFKCEVVRDSPNLEHPGQWAFGWATQAYPGTNWRPSAFPADAWEAGWLPAEFNGEVWISRSADVPE